MTTGETIRVLLVDDHRSVLWGLHKLIDGERPRMEVVGAATDRATAFTLAAEQSPDLILLDLDLGDGVSTLDFLPDLLRESRARVLVLTGVRDRAVHDRAVELGANGVVLKEEPAEIILKAIGRVHAGEYWLGREAASRAIERSRGAARTTAPEPDRLAELTPAELRVIREVVGQPSSTSREIADGLNMSVKTLNNHLTSVYSKLGVKNRLELFIYALKRGLADLSR